MRTLHQYITQEMRLTSLINSSLGNENVGEAVTLIVPVIFTESDMLEGNALNQNCFLAGDISDSGKTAISSRINDYCSNESVSDWAELPDDEKESLNREFMTIAEEEFGSNGEAGDAVEKRRVYDMLINLWQESKLVTLKRSER
jgi:hypothetical protein